MLIPHAFRQTQSHLQGRSCHRSKRRAGQAGTKLARKSRGHGHRAFSGVRKGYTRSLRNRSMSRMRPGEWGNGLMWMRASAKTVNNLQGQWGKIAAVRIFLAEWRTLTVRGSMTRRGVRLLTAYDPRVEEKHSREEASARFRGGRGGGRTLHGGSRRA